MAIVAALMLIGCTSRVQITQETDAVGLPKPSAVYVYDFAVDQSEVQVDPGGPLQRVRDRLFGSDTAAQSEQVIAQGHQIADQVAADLVARITAMGLPAQRLGRDQLPPEGAAAVGGQFVALDEGNRIKRMAIGFHQGQSSVSAAVQLYRVTGPRRAARLLDFTATGTSPPLPGAAVTMGAGAAVQVAAATAGAKELGDTLAADADRLAAAIARNLQAFFAKQGWSSPPSALPDTPLL